MLISTPIYTALGRIKKIMLFSEGPTDHDYAGPTPEPWGDHYQLYAKRSGIYCYFSQRDVAIIHCFDQVDKFGLLATSRINHVSFLRVPQGCDIPSPWAQDYLVFTPGNKYRKINFNACYANTGSNYAIEPAHLNLLKDHNVIGPYRDLPFTCAGGNILRGHHNGDDYIIIGNMKYCDATSEQLQEYMDVASQRIFRCPIETEGRFDELFYHADLYISILGKSEAVGYENKEILLGAQIRGEGSEVLNPYLDSLFERLENDENSFFKIKRIPYLVLQLGEDQYKGYSYVNCLTENYYDLQGTRQVNIIFPSFQKMLEQDLASVIDSKNTDSLELFASSVQKALFDNGNEIAMADIASMNVIPGMAKAQKKAISRKELIDRAESGIEALARQTEYELETLEKELGLHKKPKFIKDHFETLTEKRGSLHCLVKVCERDRIFLE